MTKMSCSVALLILAVASPLFAGGGGKMPFVTPEKGMAEAKRTGKPMLLYFTADW